MLLSSGEGRGTALTGSTSVTAWPPAAASTAAETWYTHEMGTRSIITSIIKQLDIKIKIKDIIPCQCDDLFFQTCTDWDWWVFPAAPVVGLVAAGAESWKPPPSRCSLPGPVTPTSWFAWRARQQRVAYMLKCRRPCWYRIMTLQHCELIN